MPYVKTVVLTVQSAQDEIISNLILPVSLRTRFPRPDFHGLTSLIRTTHHGRVWSWNFSSIISNIMLLRGSSDLVICCYP